MTICGHTFSLSDERTIACLDPEGHTDRYHHWCDDLTEVEWWDCGAYTTALLFKKGTRHV